MKELYFIIRERGEIIQILMDNNKWVDPYHITKDHDFLARPKLFKYWDIGFKESRRWKSVSPEWDYAVSEYLDRR